MNGQLPDSISALKDLEELRLDLNQITLLPFKINELVKRVRIGKVHAYIMSYLREQMPMLMGHSKKQLQLINEMGATFRSVMKKYLLAPGDFPEIESFKSIAREQDFTKFPSLKQKLIDDVEHVLGKDIPRLMDALPRSWEGDGFYIEGDVVVTGDGSGDGNGDFGNPFGDDSRPPAPPDTFARCGRTKW